MTDFGCEAELCDAFATYAHRVGWTVYPETAGWDLVLVYRGTPRPFIQTGFQIGVEAKLRPSIELLAQLARHRRELNRPNAALALLPRWPSKTYRIVANELDADVRSPPAESERDWPLRPVYRFGLGTLSLPAIVPNGSGGVPNPSPLTPWREKALRMCIRLRERGEVTTKDFRELRINHSRWVQAGWILHKGKLGRRYRYVPNLDHPRFPDRGWEQEREALATLAAPGATR